MPWILLGIALLLAQVGFWASYVTHHNDTVQEVLGGSFNTYGQSWEEEGRIIAVDVSCADIANDRMPAGIQPAHRRTATRLSQASG